MWPNSHRQFPSSSAWQPIEGTLPSIGPTTSPRLDRTPQTSQLETNEQNRNPQDTVSRIYLRSNCVQQLNGEQSEQESHQRPQMQRHLRWQPYSVANIILASEQQPEVTNSTDRAQNTSFPLCAKRLKRRIGLSRIQSSPEFDLRREDMPPRKRRSNNMTLLPEDSPSRIDSLGLPITKSRSEEGVSVPYLALSGETIDENPKPSMDPNILIGFRGKRRSSFSPYVRIVAIRLIKHAREHKVLDEWMVWCRNCDRIPVSPVTGPCGHTRCKKCVERNGACPCGAQPPSELFVDVVTLHLIDKMFQDCGASDMKSSRTTIGHGSKNYDDVVSTSVATRLSGSSIADETLLPPQIPRPLLTSAKAKKLALSPRVPMTPQVRFKYARGLISAGQLKEAVAHLARVATYADPIAYSARTLLIRTLNTLLTDSEPRSLTRQLNRLVRSHATAMWLRGSDLDCPLCLQPYTQPVTTPCGHTFCRSCIERLNDYKKPCALCQRPLYDFDLSMTEETLFISAALEAINEVKPQQPLDKNVVYIFVCTVAFPKVPCPLFIFNPRYWFMIRRVLESSERTFGMVAHDRYGINCDYGTLLEVRDCVLLENGSFILSTVGVSRFQVVETDVRDGCDVARVETLSDTVPSDRLPIWLQNVSWFTRIRAEYWLKSVSLDLRDSIEAVFGVLPEYVDCDEKFWETPDGPAWLWWFIAILPLRAEIRVLILSTKCVIKRLMAVNRILDAMKKIPNTESFDCELYNALRYED